MTLPYGRRILARARTPKAKHVCALDAGGAVAVAALALRRRFPHHLGPVPRRALAAR